MVSVNNAMGLKTLNSLTTNKNTDNKESSEKFSDILKGALNEANKLKIESDKLTEDYVVGKTDNIHEVMIASQKAEVSLMFVTEVRNRVMDAYQEFMRMQV
jgi:flagellar hook-basal body complex protein FliE